MKLCEVLDRLEKLVMEIESGEFDLEESLARFEEASKLAKKASDLLKKAELKLTTLQKEFDESLESEDDS